MRLGRRTNVLGAALIVLLTAGCHVSACAGSGCKNTGVIDTAKAQSTTRTLIAGETGAGLRGVSCPANVPLKTAAAFTCTATGADGTTAPILVTQKDDKGNVQISAPHLLHTGAVAALVAARLTRQAKAAVKVACPDLVEAHRGTTLTCTATEARGVTRAVAVTVTDDQGDISYRVR